MNSERDKGRRSRSLALPAALLYDHFVSAPYNHSCLPDEEGGSELSTFEHIRGERHFRGLPRDRLVDPEVDVVERGQPVLTLRGEVDDRGARCVRPRRGEDLLGRWISASAVDH